jgi:CheY-like chemotaxis protein
VTTKPTSLLLFGAPDPSRDVLSQLLADAGYTLSTANSTEDAFHKLQSAPPDILLLSAAAGSGSCNEAIAVARRIPKHESLSCQRVARRTGHARWILARMR